MSFIDVKPGDIETFSVATTPQREFHSSSNGVTGSVYVYADRSDIEKDLTTSSPAWIESQFTGDSFEQELKTIQSIGQYTLTNSGSKSTWNSMFANAMQTYMSHVNSRSRSQRRFHNIEINRWIPSTRFTELTARKLTVKNILNSYYRVRYPTAQWAYTNYNCLNFFTSSNTPNGAALLYPMTPAPAEHDGYCTGSYIPSGAFSFDFYINPCYRSLESIGEGANGTIPGTILHVSSTYALSLVPGTLKDVNNKQEGFRLLLQLKQSADIPPSTALSMSNVYPNNLTFVSNDNCLLYNHWHHVVVRWGGVNINNGTGSFNIDGVDAGIFVVPSSTIAPNIYGSLNQEIYCNVLTLGNYYEGNALNLQNDIGNFFGQTTSLRDGLQSLPNATLDINEPVSYAMRFPLNAQLHDVSIKRYYMSDYDIIVSSSIGPTSLDTGHKGVAFYVPPFFTQESPLRLFVGDHGGILQTPFFEVNGTTDDPFNVAMAFGVGGHYINVENFVRDFASDVYPRLHQMTGTAIAYTTAAKTANEFLYADPFVVKRNLFILPCDDGNFLPSYELLMSETLQTKFKGDVGDVDYSYIGLSNLLNESSQIFGTDFSPTGDINKTNDEIEDFANQLIGFTPENPGIQPGSVYQNYMKLVSKSIVDGTYDAGVQQGAPLTIYQRTLDNSSNQVTFFNISNLYYGDAISPKTFTLTDTNISGSNGHVKITLKDDGYGNLYRADCLTPHATWNNVGNIYYDEGVVVVKSPHLYFFGKHQFDCSFKGQRNVHVMNINVIASRNTLNSSSNPDWRQIPYSSAPKQVDNNYVYITHINFHDDNYNVIAKAQLAQPIMKQYGSAVAFKLKLDF